MVLKKGISYIINSLFLEEVSLMPEKPGKRSKGGAKKSKARKGSKK